jgi:hypothetical protein
MFRKNWFRAVIMLTVLASLLVAPLLVSAQQENGFTNVSDGATISGTVDVEGYADDPNFLRWDLFVFPGGDDNSRIWVASGDEAGEFSVSLDTTIFPDGDHALALRVVKSPAQNYDEYVVNFTLANAEAAPAVEEAAPAEEAEVAEEEVAPAEEEVAPAEEAAAPVNGFDAEDGIEVSGTVTVTGFADTAGFVKWQLDVIPFGEADDAIFAAYGEDAGEFSYALDTTQFPDGDHQLRLRVVDDTGNYDEYFVDVTVANGEVAPAEEVAVEAAETMTDTVETAEAEAPAEVEAAPAEARANGLDLEDGATVSGTVDVTGYADDPNFLRWDLFVLPGGDDSAKIWVASGDEAGEFTVTLDTTQFPDGEHAFSLRVVTSPRQNYTEYITNFVLANAE